MARPRIYVAGYPRSGTTWLCRLIADAWNCPTGSMYDSDVFYGHAAEGKDRTGPFVVLHGHKSPDKLKADLKPGDFVIFVYRDPRDVIVSIAHYFAIPLDEAIRDGINGRPGARGPRRFPIIEYIRMWLNSSVDDYNTKYELLHTEPELVFLDIAYMVRFGPDLNKDITEVIQRQSFQQRKVWTETYGDSLNFGKEYHLRFMRKGIVGDWRNHFDFVQAQLVWNAMGEEMERLGYER